MNPPAITLEVLPAGYGDCLLISCPVGRHIDHEHIGGASLEFERAC